MATKLTKLSAVNIVLSNVGQAPVTNIDNDNPMVVMAANVLDEVTNSLQSEGWTFPFAFDESQDVARAYGAACTPDFFLFDGKRELVYRGQLDDSRPRSGTPVTGKDLRAALNAVLDGGSVSPDQTPSMGCGIKWHR